MQLSAKLRIGTPEIRSHCAQSLAYCCGTAEPLLLANVQSVAECCGDLREQADARSVNIVIVFSELNYNGWT